jgi:hypothetical protein
MSASPEMDPRLGGLRTYFAMLGTDVEVGPRRVRTIILSDIRQLGPKRQRDISGVCSACKSILLARLDETEWATPTTLRAKLEKVLERHVAEMHSNKPKPGVLVFPAGSGGRATTQLSTQQLQAFRGTRQFRSLLYPHIG